MVRFLFYGIVHLDDQKCTEVGKSGSARVGVCEWSGTE